MGVKWGTGAELPEGTIFADRELYLDVTGTKLVRAGTAASASQLCGQGHPIEPAVQERLGLFLLDGVVVQRGSAEAEAPINAAPAGGDELIEPDAAANGS